jgi:hypothetical protein
MTTTADAVRDSATMLRRNLRRLERYPSLALFPILIPVVLLLLFVYIFGGALGNGLGGPPGGRSAYISYLAPWILLFTIVGAAQMVAISIAKDMTEGTIARFRTMAIWRPSVLAGHVLANVIQSLLSVCVVVGVALLTGFRPTADTLDWLGAAGLLAFAALAGLAMRRARPRHQARRGGQQPAHAPDPAVLPGQRLRARRFDARRHPLVRRAPAVHAHHRHPARPTPRRTRRHQRHHRHHLVRRHHRPGVSLGPAPVQPPPHPLIRAGARLELDAQTDRRIRAVVVSLV